MTTRLCVNNFISSFHGVHRKPPPHEGFKEVPVFWRRDHLPPPFHRLSAPPHSHKTSAMSRRQKAEDQRAFVLATTTAPHPVSREMSVNVETPRPPSPDQPSPSSALEDVNSAHEASPTSTIGAHHSSKTQEAGGPGLKPPTTGQMNKHGTGRDVEKQAPRPTESPVKKGEDDDQWVVKWDGDDDPKEPLNMPTWRKQLVLSYLSGEAELTRMHIGS